MLLNEIPFTNRELSWLEFNERILDQARDPSLPLLERLKFLSITSSNLDEFFMVRVGGIQMLATEGIQKPDPSGYIPEEQLDFISKRVHEMSFQQYNCYKSSIEPALAEAKIRRVLSAELTSEQHHFIECVFENEIFPILSPIAVTPPINFPLLANKQLHIAVRLKPDDAEPDTPRYAIIPVGKNISRFITLPSASGYQFMMIEDILIMYINRFFPGESVSECVPFRITRNADLCIREDLAFDLLAEMEAILDARKRSDCVRLEIADNCSDTIYSFLQNSLQVDNRECYKVSGPLDLSEFMKITELQGYHELKNPVWPPQASPVLEPGHKIFDILNKRDVLLYHPYESFEPVVRLIDEASDDPDVLTIKQILYRTSRKSPIVSALIRAAEKGKYVTAIVELKARFDEERNIEWAKELEDSGVQVLYGVKGLKTHAKVCLIVRRGPHGLIRYIHFGTGNYNEITAHLYSDISYLTSDEDLGSDVSSFFNAITGYSQPIHFRKIEAAPIGLREKILDLIQNEIERKRQGQNAFIRAKMNSLADPIVIKSLYRASQAGVKIELNIRGICCLRPGIEGISENIAVTSIVDRYLEHSRILHFHHGG
ncbi:MAG: polyphosphate kinase 1, partial [Fibrobacter sp.]|nr:polyphosphate kinase 1 [Fibrobacter sp.]